MSKYFGTSISQQDLCHMDCRCHCFLLPGVSVGAWNLCDWYFAVQFPPDFFYQTRLLHEIFFNPVSNIIGLRLAGGRLILPGVLERFETPALSLRASVFLLCALSLECINVQRLVHISAALSALVSSVPVLLLFFGWFTTGSSYSLLSWSEISFLLGLTNRQLQYFDCCALAIP
jgi:hypothetical protein